MWAPAQRTHWGGSSAHSACGHPTPSSVGGPSSLGPWKGLSILQSLPWSPCCQRGLHTSRGRPPQRRDRFRAVSPGRGPKPALQLQKGGMPRGPSLQVCPGPALLLLAPAGCGLWCHPVVVLGTAPPASGRAPLVKQVTCPASLPFSFPPFLPLASTLSSVWPRHTHTQHRTQLAVAQGCVPGALCPCSSKAPARTPVPAPPG